MAPAATQADDDPVIAEYDVFITPELEEQLYVLQYVDRVKGYGLTKRNNSEPSQLRIKEESGFIEVDVPMDIRSNFNRPAAVKWGEALRKTKGFGQKAYGIYAGFERAMPRPIRTGSAGNTGTPAPIPTEDDDNLEEWIINLEDASEKGHVLNTQTFGGQVTKSDGDNPNYMLGAFRGKELHLTRINGLARMRTQFHHIDATTQLEAANRRREKESQEGAKPAEPKALIPVVRKAGGDTSVEIAQAFMKAANVERWKKLKYSDEDSEHAFAFYTESLFHKETSEAPPLHSDTTNPQFDVSGRGLKKKTSHRRNEDPIEISDVSDEE